jgi:hypothetical protein
MRRSQKPGKKLAQKELRCWGDELDDELVCGEKLPDEMAVLCDWRNPIMKLENQYKNIATF